LKMAKQKQVLSVRDRMQYKAFLLFYYQHSRPYCEDDTRNPDYIADVLLRFATALFESRDELFDRTKQNRPELVALYEHEFSHRHTGGGYRNRSSFVL